MTMNYRKAPFPYAGGKSKAAPLIWKAFGDVDHYVEPFCGTMAVLLNRPHEANRTYYSETVSDADGLLINAWRSIQLHPQATAEACSNPVAEADMHARHAALVLWRRNNNLELLCGDPAWCDPVMGGWWLWGIACWIGSGWCAGTGAWTPVNGRLTKQARNTREPGVARKLPHIADDGQGVNHAGAREPGVNRQLPLIISNGQGVNLPQAREPGVNRQLPDLANDGRGVNLPQAREPGVRRKLPLIISNGQGVNLPQAREPGVTRQLPHLANDGRGVNRPQAREPGVDDDEGEFHPVTMPEIRRWFDWLSARIRHVRIVNGDWQRVCTTGALQTLPVRMSDGHTGILLDPPYADTASRSRDMYAHDSLDVAHDVRAWCLTNGGNPKYRIALCGYENEHGTQLVETGWTEHEWFTTGFLRGGMGDQQHRERIWLSPHCLDLNPPDPAEQQLELWT